MNDDKNNLENLFLARVVWSDYDIEVFNTFCESFTSDMDKIFNGLSRRIRSPSIKRTRF